MFEHNLDNLSVKQLSDMGYSFLCNHEYKKAIICFKKVADLYPTYEHVYFNIGECQINLGLYNVKAASDCPYFREIKCPLFIDRKSLNVYSSFSSAFS